MPRGPVTVAIRVAAASLAVVAWTVVAAQAQAQDAPAGDEPPPPHAATVTGEEVNIRSGPSVDYYPLGRLDRGDLVVTVGADGDWTRVRVPGGVPLYVAAEFVEVEERALHGRIVADDVLLRANPSRAYFPVHDQKLRVGDPVLVLGEEEEQGLDEEPAPGDGVPARTWLRILPPDRIHVWVHSSLLVDVGEARLQAEELEAAGRARRDMLTEGRSRAEREARAEAARTRAMSELQTIENRLLTGEAGAEDAAAARAAAASAPSRGIREAALALARRIDAAVAARETDAARERAEAAALAEEARRRRIAEAAREHDERMKELGRPGKPSLGPPVAEGWIRKLERGLHLVGSDGRPTYRIRSHRFRVPDFAGRRVSLHGTVRKDAEHALPELEIDHLLVVTR